MNERQRQRKNSGGGFGTLIAILVVISMVRGMASSEGGSPLLIVMASIFMIAVVLVGIAAKKAAVRRAADTPPSERVRQAVPTARSRSAGAAGTQGAARVAPTISMEGYDSASNTERDQQRRRQQLDTFLKNGIIDRREYLMLLERHERNS